MLLPAIVFALLLAVLAYSAREALVPRTAVHVVPVVVKPIAGASTAGSAIVQASGWVEADPYPVAVTALADGVVQEMPVLEGQTVRSGQVVGAWSTKTPGWRWGVPRPMLRRSRLN